MELWLSLLAALGITYYILFFPPQSTEVSYVELEIRQKPPSQKLLNPQSTVYATIM